MADNQDDFIKDQLDDLTQMISKVYFPLMEKQPDQRLQMDKFIKNIQLSVQQAYGNITIKVPELPHNLQYHEMADDRELVSELISTVEQWTSTIKETIEREEIKKRNKVCESASKETEYWRSRAATFNTLNQQLTMPQVKQILEVMKIVEEKEGFSMGIYNEEYAKFVKAQAVARDFVKFLSTLDRQFKNIAKGDLQIIEETLPTLLTGLKLIWTISRHINHCEDDFIAILRAISTEICQKVKDKIQLNKIFQMKNPDEALNLIKLGKKVLQNWKAEFDKTRIEIEKQAVRRWDFQQQSKEIFATPQHMVSVLDDLETAHIIVQQFFAILSPELQAVTGSVSTIEKEQYKVRSQVTKLEQFNKDVFNEAYKASWSSTFEKFKDSVQGIDTSVIDLIQKTFSKNLTSSESAFDLLDTFQGIQTREKIKEILDGKYEDVLVQYERELKAMESLFLKHKDKPPIAKNMPEKAGMIAWARSIMGRIKAPIDKFKTKANKLRPDKFMEVATQYVKLAKQLDQEFEQTIYLEWKKINAQKVVTQLNDKILKSAQGQFKKSYTVNFAPELKVTIREAKFLSQIGKDIPSTIINIALQEKDYMRHIDKLEQLLRAYDSALNNLKPVECRLLNNEIKKLNRFMDKGVENHNWFSLSIDQYIQECKDAIDGFNEKKNTVVEYAKHIEMNVVNIENAEIIKKIDFQRKTPMDIPDFYAYFDTYRKKQLVELVKDYQNIGDQYLKSIEESTVKNQLDNTKSSDEMKPYYAYWERRIFNAITKMIVRALAANKTIWIRNEERPFLVRMSSSYNFPEVQFHPNVDELKTTLEKFTKNILESTKSFGRWWDGHCKIFEEVSNEENADKYIPYTFFEDVMQNKMITQLNYEIVKCKNQITDKFELIVHALKKKNRLQDLFDKGRMSKVQKMMEKSKSTATLENYITNFRTMRNQILNLDPLQPNYFVIIDNTEIRNATIEKIDEWLRMVGESLKGMASAKLTTIIAQTEKYTKDLSKDITDKTSLQEFLETIAEIKNISMEMEFRIIEVQEQYRVLSMYEYPIEEEIQKEVDTLMTNWEELNELADKQDNQVKGFKKNFSEVTKTQVDHFKEEIQKEYDQYKLRGPGTNGVPLEEGIQLLSASKEKVSEFNKTRLANVQAEKLFNLEISKYPKLVEMEELNKKYDEIYSIFAEFKNKMDDFGQMPWSKLDAKMLIEQAETFKKTVKKLGNKNPQFEIIPPFIQLGERVNGFAESLPLIQMLKHPAVVERHWIRIMEETGQEVKGDFNLKSLSLDKVFSLNLGNYEESVQAICTEAKEEANNETKMQEIEDVWKKEQFEFFDYVKNGVVVCYTIKSPDEIKQQLEDNVLVLQSLAASKYVRAIAKRVQSWERDLNRIGEVIDLWMITQRKWQYLEKIFSFEDIKMQLPDEAKKFGKTDGNYKKIMENAYKMKNVYQNCVKAEGGARLDDLKNINMELDKAQKGLNNYLDSKQVVFPRFYFISSDDLLQILGSTDPTAIQRFMLNLFDNCKRLNFINNNKIIEGMTSDEGEKYDYVFKVKPEGKIEEWMNVVNDEMKNTLEVIAKQAVWEYARSDRIDWIKKQIGMIALVGTQIWWTFSVEDVFNRVKKGDIYAMKNELAKQTKDLLDLITLIRQDINKLLRKCINTLIILDVHAREIVSDFVRDSVLNAKEFAWESQLRFYWDKDKDNIVIRQCTGAFDYCYEYQGLNGRLVITPLTDRCIMTLTTALTFRLGGSPAGPAGTGKTETVKDLAKGLACRCVVTCCGENLDYAAMGTIFSGLAQTGFWGCFDEFNRINVEVLSVVSSQITCIQRGLTFGQKTIPLIEGQDINLVPTIGIFITMNPGYAGRSELPDNLKALFRPVTMVVPDLQMICENMLMSEGFETARVLSKKMVVLYKLSKEQLSKQYHYDFGLRALKSVLVMAGSLKRQYSDMNEAIVLMRALRDMNMPKFVFEDVPLFKGLIQDLFPNLRADRVGYEELNNYIIEHMMSKNLRHSDRQVFDTQVDKVVQLYETMLTRHTTMVVGPTGAGKSVIIDTLAAALKPFTGYTTCKFTINPKMITLNELYGVLDPDSRDWTDGLLSKIFKEINVDLQPDKPEFRWIIYDGDVDAIWVENMNSVMDDNKILTLANNDRIRLLDHCKMLFEVFDLQYASPATISRCGMVYVDAKDLGYAPFYERWVMDKKVKYSEGMAEAFTELYQKFVPACIERILEGSTGGEEEVQPPLKCITPRTNLNLVQQLCTLIDSILPPMDSQPPPPEDADELERFFVFCLTWSLGGALVESDREIFSDFIYGLASIARAAGTLYDNYFLFAKNNFQKWDSLVEDYEPPSDNKFASILVPTVDTVRYSWMQQQIMNLKKPVLFCGDSGTAKTVTVQACFKKLSKIEDKYMFLNINFSSRTTSLDFQNIIEENIDKKTFKSYGPKSAGKKMVIFIDDMNMPKIDTYGTQQPLALALFLISRQQLYQREGDLELRDIIDTQFAACISPVSSGGNRVDPRVMTLFSVFNITFPSRETTEKIYTKILEKHVGEFHEDIRNIVPKITQATMNIYFQCIEKLPRTPVKFHYIFNLRDLSRVFEGLLQSTIDKFNEKQAFVRLWRNEVSRVFVDRLIDDTDKELVSKNMIPEIVNESFGDVKEAVLADPIILGDFAMANPTDNEAEDPRLYEDLGGYEQLSTKMYKMLEEYGYEYKPMELVLFNDALEHVTKIHRIIRFPKGCALLVGFGGSGKQSLTKLATFTAGYGLFTINLIRGYKEPDFREDLRSLYKMVLDKPQTFMFTDAHVQEEGFLELINNILTIGMVPALFPEEEKDGLMSKTDEEIRKLKLPETKEFRWNYYVNRSRENLHIVLCMSPSGNTLMLRCRYFPGLVSSTSIDWFQQWPEDALTAVANNFMGAVELEGDQREKVTQHLVMVHLSVQKFSIDYKNIYKRNNFSTPKNYLDFINNYIIFLKEKRKFMDAQVRRYDGGLKQLAAAAQATAELSKELQAKNEIIAEKKAQVEELLKDIAQKSEVAAVDAAAAAEKKEFLDKQSIVIAKEEAEAQKALAEAKPALEAAKEAIKDIDPAAINTVKALNTVSATIENACLIAYYMYPGTNLNQSDWSAIKTGMLSKMDLFRQLSEFQVDKVRNDGAKKAQARIEKFKKENKFESDDEVMAFVKTASGAAAGLYKWAACSVSAYWIFKDVEPKRKKAEQMKAQKIKGEKELAETEAKVAALNANLAELRKTQKEKQDELDGYISESEKMTRKLNAASQLINGLAGEQKRWSEDMGRIAEDKIKLVGDCLTGSAFLSYCGPFNSVLRQRMIFDTWKPDITEKELPCSDNFKLDTFLTNEVTISQWASEGLPTDELSVQNGILTTQASRWPLCIDPQMQAVSWIKEKEKRNQFDILTFNMGDYIKKLEIAINFGKSVLFEAVGEELDPMIDPVLEKNFIKEAGVIMLQLGDQKIPYNEDFRLFMTTQIGNPNYTPEVFGKTMIINFSVTMPGLRDQLLNEVVQYERPELEEARKKLVIETSQNKSTLKELEDTLLSELAKDSDVPLVDNVPLIETLNTAKSKSIEISKALEEAAVTTADIQANRDNYRGVAWRGSILFFSIAGLSNIESMYEYSLASYMTVFMNALTTSRKDNILANRLRIIKDKLTQLVYDFACMGIFEKHKLMYSFQMITMIMDGDNELNKIELDFFLKGNTSLDAVERKKPYAWLSDNGWKDIQKLETLGEVWNGFIHNLESNGKAWKEWYDLDAPEQAEIPNGYSKTLSKFQILLLMRVIRQDRVINQIKNFIAAQIQSDYYIKSPVISYEKVYQGSTNKTPIVFILSPGADPFSDVSQLVDSTGLGQNKFKYCALGQGMGDVAKSMIERGAIHGHWVMLQNCHLLVSWLPKLEAIYDNLQKADKGFRLWLTTNPTDKFPLGILQKSIKVVTEPPDGLGQNIKNTYSKLSEDIFNECPKKEFKPMLYVLSFFHAVIQERKKFGKIGWNVNYDFNESDFKISFRLISMYLTKAHETGDEELPWQTLRYLIGDAMYGGRVTDGFDRRVLVTYLEEYLGPFIFDKNQKFYFSRSGSDYLIPQEETFEQNLEFIDNIPLFTTPGVFGLHSNAEITYFNNAAKSLWVNILEMQTSEGGDGGGIDKDAQVMQISNDLLDKTIPEIFDEYNIRKSFNNAPSPAQTVLLQELERFNKLITRMRSSIIELKRALNGEIGMNTDLDSLSTSFFNGKLPPMWAKLAPPTEKNLVNWVSHFERRNRQYRDWVEIEEPKVMWLSGLHIPESYTTALIQTTCRAKDWALDKSGMTTQVTKYYDPSEVKERLEHGTYVTGLYIEGARWNDERGVLDYQNPKELVQMMPLVKIVPVEANKIKLRGTMKVPVYTTQARSNAMGVGLSFIADLKTDKHVSHWVLQGVAMMLNIE